MHCALLTGKEKSLHTRTQPLRNSCKLLCPNMKPFFPNPFIFQLRILAGFSTSGVGWLLFTLIYLPIQTHQWGITKKWTEGCQHMNYSSLFSYKLLFCINRRRVAAEKGNTKFLLKEIPFCYAVDLHAGKCVNKWKTCVVLPALPSPSPELAVQKGAFGAYFVEDFYCVLLKSNLKLIIKQTYLHICFFISSGAECLDSPWSWK